MGFKKGHIKTGGRKKGTLDKKTILLKERRDVALALVDDVLTFVKEEMQSLDKDRKLRAIDKLPSILPFILPKLSSVDAAITGDVSVNSIVFEDAESNKD